jgi:hypothetical protein
MWCACVSRPSVARRLIYPQDYFSKSSSFPLTSFAAGLQLGHKVGRSGKN